MTYSQINPTKVGGFSRRSLNLNHFGQGHVSQEQVKRYIQEQEGKDVFEYDIFNCPKELKGQLKIGDFGG